MPRAQERPTRLRTTEAGHRWVGAALLDLGRGETNRRAEHAARTGRHVLTPGTRVEVLEVYCADCRVPFGQGLSDPCSRRAAARAG